MYGVASLTLGPHCPLACSNLGYFVGWRRKPGRLEGREWRQREVTPHGPECRLCTAVTLTRDGGMQLEGRQEAPARSLQSKEGRHGTKRGPPGAWPALCAPEQRGRVDSGSHPEARQDGAGLPGAICLSGGGTGSGGAAAGAGAEGRAGVGPPGLSERQTRHPPPGPVRTLCLSECVQGRQSCGSEGAWEGLRFGLASGPRPPLPPGPPRLRGLARLPPAPPCPAGPEPAQHPPPRLSAPGLPAPAVPRGGRAWPGAPPAAPRTPPARLPGPARAAGAAGRSSASRPAAAFPSVPTSRGDPSPSL